MRIKYLLIAYLLLFSCARKNDHVIVFDLEKEYPQKELDYSKSYNIEYRKISADSLPIGTLKIVYVSNDSIIGFSKDSRSIYVFRRDGNLLSYFCKTGNSGEEYLGIRDAFYDKAKGEIYLLDITKGQIIVYDLLGGFKRRFLHNQSETRIDAIRNYSNGEFICYNNTHGIIKEDGNSYSIKSKETGEIVRNIHLSIPEKRTPYIFHSKGVFPAYEIPFGYSKDCMYLNESACDTIYQLNLRNGDIFPRVIKTPSVLSYEKSHSCFLYLIAETEDYISFYKLVVKHNPESRPLFISSYYFYDKADEQIYEESSMLPLEKKSSNPFANGYIGSFASYGESIHAYIIKQRGERGDLKGALKVMADSIGENENPIMRILTTK